MKTILLAFFLHLFIQSFAVAQVLGGKIIAENKEMGSLYLECLIQNETPCLKAVLVTDVNGVKVTHPKWLVPIGNGFEEYSERWSIFNEIFTEASIRMPPVPEIRYLYLVNQSMKSYRLGFKALDDVKSSSEYKMKSLFFEKLIQFLSED